VGTAFIGKLTFHNQKTRRIQIVPNRSAQEDRDYQRRMKNKKRWSEKRHDEFIHHPDASNLLHLATQKDRPWGYVPEDDLIDADFSVLIKF
jgi:hypothetical protein